MTTQKSKYFSNDGITLIEAVVAIGLVSLIVLSLYTALFNATKLFGDAKQKAVAVALANEKMEIIRNLAYDDIGTQGWIPEGPLLQTENISKNGFEYVVNTSIEYVDDPFDGQGGADLIETDYKQARVEVTWTANDQPKSLVFITKFVPNGLESDVGGGVLSINAVNGGGIAIPSVTVTVDSVDDSPAIHGSVVSDGEGNVRLPGLPAQEYKITVSKSEWETVATYPNPPDSAFTPLDQNLLVVNGGLVMKTITLNKSGNLTIEAVNIADDSGIDGVDVDLVGGRVIGNSPTTYNLEQTETTDSSGDIELIGISPGNYDITNLAALETAELKYIGADTSIPISLTSEETKQVKLLFAPKNDNSLLIRVKDSATLDEISAAQVHVSATDFDQTLTTGSDGLAYFPMSLDPPAIMTVQDYDIEIQVTGYATYTDTVSVNNLTEHEALMHP